MQLIYVRTATPLGLAICLASWSTWSHVAIADGDDVIHATAAHGVYRRSRQGLLDYYSKHIIQEVPVPDEAAAIAFSRAQIGKPYDWSAYWGFIDQSRDWQDPSAWHYSELAGASLVEGGHALPAPAARMTPGMLRAWTRVPS